MTMTTEENSKGSPSKTTRNIKQAATEKYGESVMNEAEAKQKGKEEIGSDGFVNLLLRIRRKISKRPSWQHART